MSIFNQNTIPVGPEVIVVNQLKQQAISTLASLKKNYVNSYNQVWNNPKVTADKIVTAFGTDAVELFAVSAATAQLLVLCGVRDIPTVMPDIWNFKANNNGSVTLTKK